MMRFYPGCTLSSSAKAYYRSLQWVFQRLERPLVELPEWSCCGATSAHALHRDLAYALPARNLAIAHALRSDLMVACSACYHRLKVTQRALENAQFRERMQDLIGRPLDASRRIQNVLEILNEESLVQLIRQRKTKAIEGLKVACYFGCLATRIPRVSGFDSVEAPTSMERLVSATGAIALDWPYKTQCCGASFSVTNEEISRKMCDRILQMARRCGADMLVTSCPFCQYNLDWAQWPRERERLSEQSIPVIFLTQLLGLALGAGEKELMLGSNLAGSERLLCPLRQRTI